MKDRIEAAVSARAKCRVCKAAIGAGELRFGETASSDFGDDNTTTVWYHLACAASKRPDKLRPVLAKYKKAVPDRDALEATIETASISTRLDRIRHAERSPTGRAKCQQCRKVIEKDTLRVVLTIDSDPLSPGTGFMHAGCVRAFGGDGVVARLKARSKKLAKADWRELEELL